MENKNVIYIALGKQITEREAIKLMQDYEKNKKSMIQIFLFFFNKLIR